MPKMRPFIFATLVLCSNHAAATTPFNLQNTVFESVGNELDIDPLLLYAVAITESAVGVGDGNIKPEPYVIRTSEGPTYFSSKEEAQLALAIATTFSKNIDVGMMQINLHFHPHDDPSILLDPVINLRTGAEYLKKMMQTTTDPIIGVGRYHSWTRERAEWYGARVWKTYYNLQHLISSSGEDNNND
jgi:hypothetical protein